MIVSNNIKYLGVFLAKQVKGLHDKNVNRRSYKKMKDLSCTKNSIFNIVKITILPKGIFRFNTVFMKILPQYYTHF